jgi:hypothetical protein
MLAMAVSLAACGGGGGAGSGEPASASLVATPPPVATAGAPAPADCSIALWGDSLLAGQSTVGALAQSPAQFIRSARPRYTVDDFTISGSGGNEAEAGFRGYPLTDRFVVLEWGANDTTEGYTDITGVLTRDVQWVQSHGKTPILTGIDPAYNNPLIIAQPIAVAKATGAAYAGWDTVQGGTVDGLHPDQATSNALAQKIIDVLDTLAPECK